MSKPPTTDDFKESLSAHIAAKGEEIQAKYGPRLGWNELQQILADRACVRYPCTIRFDAGPLLEGEFAHPVPLGARPEEGFVLHVHPYFAVTPERVPWLALYQLVVVNYGDFVSPEDAEVFGAAALGIPREEYYRGLCQMADEIAASGPAKTGATQDLQNDEQRKCGPFC